jgi:hypothetical protein
MSARLNRSLLIAFGLFAVCLAALGGVAGAAAPTGDTIPPVAPVLLNGDVECATGYYTTTNAVGRVIYIPNDWQLVISNGAPPASPSMLALFNRWRRSKAAPIALAAGF